MKIEREFCNDVNRISTAIYVYNTTKKVYAPHSIGINLEKQLRFWCFDFHLEFWEMRVSLGPLTFWVY